MRLADEALRYTAGVAPHDLLALVDVHGIIRDVNPEWDRLWRNFGGAADTCGVGSNYLAQCRRAGADGVNAAHQVADAIEALFSHGGQRVVEYECIALTDAQGEVVRPAYWYRVLLARIERDGHPHVLLHHTPVSPQQSPTEHATSAAFLSAVLGVIGDAVIATDASGVVKFWNRAAETLYGYRPDDAIGRTVMDLTVPDTNREQADAIMQALSTGRRWTGEFTVQHRDGARFPVQVTDVPIMDSSGQCVGIVGQSVDLRPVLAREKEQEQLRALESQLGQRQKLEALGTLAGGVAHEFNNVLAAILGYAELLREEHAEHPDALAPTEGIIEATERARDIVRGLLTFSRPTPQVVRNVDVDQWLRSSMQLVRALLPTSITVDMPRTRQHVTVRANPTQLTQALLNLANNAAHAMKTSRERRLTIRTELTHFDDPYPATSSLLAPGTWLMCEVRDTGVGMSADVQRRIFEPFFTTKDPGEGTGLGMSLVHGIMSGLGGGIEIISAEGSGTAVRLFLPVVDAPPDTTHPTPTSTLATSRGTRLLLLDDDVIVLKALSRILDRAGFEALPFADHDEALERVRQGLEDPSQAIDLVMLDYAMPVHRGDEVARELRAMGVACPIVICTGNAAEMGTMPSEVTAIIEKPVRGAELIEMLERVLVHG